MKQVNIKNARSSDQIKALTEIEKKGVCPFCSREYMETKHPHPILLENEHWYATKNRWPYENTKEHLLLVCKEGHPTHPKELSSAAWKNLHSLVLEISEKLSIPNATLIMRYGNMGDTGATVTHLHAQVITGSGEKPVIARVG